MLMEALSLGARETTKVGCKGVLSSTAQSSSSAVPTAQDAAAPGKPCKLARSAFSLPLWLHVSKSAVWCRHVVMPLLYAK